MATIKTADKNRRDVFITTHRILNYLKWNESYRKVIKLINHHFTQQDNYGISVVHLDDNRAWSLVRKNATEAQYLGDGHVVPVLQLILYFFPSFLCAHLDLQLGNVSREEVSRPDTRKKSHRVLFFFCWNSKKLFSDIFLGKPKQKFKNWFNQKMNDTHRKRR